jgi:transposase
VNFQAIRLAETIGNRPAAKRLGLEESNVREWRKRKSELEQLPANKRTKRHAKPKWMDLEVMLAEWFLDRKRRELYVTANMIKEKGMELARQNGTQ